MKKKFHEAIFQYLRFETQGDTLYLERVVHYEFISDDANLLSEQLERMYAIVQQKHSTLVNRKKVFLP